MASAEEGDAETVANDLAMEIMYDYQTGDSWWVLIHMTNLTLNTLVNFEMLFGIW